jgi:hypothetical protein
MTKILFILIVLVFSGDLFPQISVSNNQLNFSQVYVGLKDSSPFYLINKNSQSVIVKSVNTVNSSFYLSNNSFTVPASDSLLIFLYFSPKQNVIESGTMTLATDDSSLAVYLNFSGSGAYNDFYQNTTFNLYDTPLKNALASLVANHTSLGYNTARDRMFDTIDKQPGDTIECIYSGIKIKAQNRTQLRMPALILNILGLREPSARMNQCARICSTFTPQTVAQITPEAICRLVSLSIMLTGVREVVNVVRILRSDCF